MLGLEKVSTDAHLFDDLGANSLLLAQFCAKVRRHPDLAPVSIREVYQHPTVTALAALPSRPPARLRGRRGPAAPPVTPGRARSPTRHAVSCSCSCSSPRWSRGRGAGDRVPVGGGRDRPSSTPTCVRSPGVPATFFGYRAAADRGQVVARRALQGRASSPLWGTAYLRFWLVKTLIRANPIDDVHGVAAVHLMYLRALGARIGKGAVVLSPRVAACPDLLTVGPGTVVREDSALLCYRAEAGRIRLGRVTLGRERGRLGEDGARHRHRGR